MIQVQELNLLSAKYEAWNGLKLEPIAIQRGLMKGLIAMF
jgi:hypothetical protein